MRQAYGLVVPARDVDARIEADAALDEGVQHGGVVAVAAAAERPGRRAGNELVTIAQEIEGGRRLVALEQIEVDVARDGVRRPKRLGEKVQVRMQLQVVAVLQDLAPDVEQRVRSGGPRSNRERASS